MAEFISVPLKKSSDVDIVKPLQNIIRSTYNNAENVEDYNEAINELSRLRTAAIWKVFEKSSLEVIYSYYDQLVSLESKIPPQEVQIPFKWKDAFDKGSFFAGRMSLTISSLAYEKVCILFNMAALQSSTAASQPLDTEESLKQAVKLFQQAVGIFNYLKENVMMAVHQETTPDLNPETLTSLSQLMLAQAQEVVIHKMIKDEMNNGIISKAANQCQEFYMDCLRSMQKESVKHLWDRDWIPTVQAKQLGLQGLSQYYESLSCKANKDVGTEISRLKVAVECIKNGIDTIKQCRVSQITLFQEHLIKAQRNLADAIKDNDFIYHARIPDSKQLEPIGRVAIAKGIPVADRYNPGTKDLFASLVPAVVQHALMSSSNRKSEAINTEINKLREATQLLNSVLASLNLPAAIEQVSSSGLPNSIMEKARAVRQAGGVEALKNLMTELPELLQRNRDILDEADRMLAEEAESDNSLRRQFGERWTRTPSAKLTETFVANASKYRQIIDNAVRADYIVQQKFEKHQKGIETLSSSDTEITAGIPAAQADNLESAAVATLRQLMEDVDTIKAERDVIESELKSATVDMKAKFLEALAKDGAIDEPLLSMEALGKAIAPLSRQVRDSITRQEDLIKKIQNAHEQFQSERGAGTGGSRDAVLCKLAAAHDAFTELRNNLNEGVKFYNDLTQLLVTFQNKISDYCFARRTEKEELMKDLTQDASRGTQPPPTTGGGVKKEPPPRPPPPAPSNTPSGAPPAATQLPYPSQPHGMPQPYQPAAAAPYPYYQPPPMPPMYNPYATMPFPHSTGYPPTYVQGAQYQGYQYPPNTQYQYPQQSGYNPYQNQQQ